MKRLGILFGALVFFSACTNGPVTGTYELAMDAQDAARREALSLAAMRVVERRIQSMQVSMIEQAIRQEDDTMLMDVTVDDRETIELLTEQLRRPFTLRVMAQASAEQADATVEGHGGFRMTNVTQADIDWVEAAEDAEGKGAVRIVFTEEGKTKMQTLMQAEQGRSIGVFVRDVLVSLLPAATMESVDITIRGIPDLAMAEAFADDVNTGTHITFLTSPPPPSLP